MLLIPIGAEDGESRAKPVVTIVLIVADIAWFVLTSAGSSTWEQPSTS